MVNQAAKLGLTMAIMPVWGCFVNNSSSCIFNTTTAYNFGYFLGSRYANNPNIMWMLGGDSDATSTASQAIWQAIGQGLQAGDGGTHLITYHPQGMSSSYASFAPSNTLLNFDMIQSGHISNYDNWDLVAAGYAAADKPVIDGEENYENIPSGLVAGNPRITDYDVRKKAYWSVFAGAAGATYGCNDVYQFYEPGYQPLTWANTSWQTAMFDPGATQMQYLKNLMLSRPYFNRVPDQSMIISNALTGGDHIQATRDSTGAYAFIYSASGQPFTVDMTQISGGKVNATWYNPRNGQATPVGSYANTGTMTFTPPSNGNEGDWVLVLDDATKGYGTPGQVTAG